MKQVSLIFIVLVLALSYSPELIAKKTSKKQVDDWTLYSRSGHRSEAWNELVQAAFEAFSNNNLSIGIQHLQSAIEKGCNDPLVNYKVGQYYEGKEDYDKAMEYYKASSAKMPKHYPKSDAANSVFESYGRTLFALKRYPEAKEALTKATEQNPKSFTALFLLGQIAKEEDDMSAAIEYFTKALDAPLPEAAESNLPLTLSIELALAYYKTGDYDNALKYCDQALNIVPNYPAASKMKSKIECNRQWKKQKEAIEKMIQ